MNVVLLPFFLAFIISLGVSAYAWQRRAFTPARSFAIVTFLEAVYTLAYILELLAPGINASLFWDNVQFVVLLLAPLGFLHFALLYTNRTLRHARAIWTTLGILSAAGIVLVLTSDWHGLLRQDIYLAENDLYHELHYTFAPGFSLFGGYALLLTLTADALLLRELIRAERFYRPRIAVVTVGMLVPLIGSGLVLLRVSMLPNVEEIPLAFALGNLIIAWGLFRYHLLDLAPIARATLVENLADAMFVVDLEHRLLDMNRAAEQLVGMPRKQATGRVAFKLFPQWSYIAEAFPDFDVQTQFEVTIGGDSDADSGGQPAQVRYAEIRLAPVRDIRSVVIGRMVILRDITDRKRTEHELRTYQTHLEEFVQARTADLIAANEQLNTEVAERERAQHALEISDERYRRATQAGQVGIWEWSFTERTLYVAPEVFSMLGYTPGELPNTVKAWSQLIDPRDIDRLNAGLQSVIQGPSDNYEINLRMMHKTNGVRWIAMRGTMLRTEDNAPLRMLGTVTDITEVQRMVEALQRRDAILQAVNHAATRLLNTVDWREVVPPMLGELGRATGVEIATLFRARPGDQGAWDFQLYYHWRAESVPAGAVAPENRNFQISPRDALEHLKRWQQGEVVTVHSRELSIEDRAQLLEWEIESLLDVPILVSDELWGVISLHKCHEQRDWMPNEIEALQTAASILGTAIERQAARESLQRHADWLKALHRIDRAILAAESTENIIFSALGALHALVPHKRASVTQFDTQAGTARVLVALTRNGTRLSRGTVVKLDDVYFSGLPEGQTRILDDLDREDPQNETIQRLRAEGVRCVMNVPLLYENELIGTLNLGHSLPNRFNQQDLETVQQVAAQLAIAIHQARLREQVQAYAEELEQRVAQRTAELEATMRDLQEATQVKDAFVSNVSHELRTPISNLKLYLDLLEMRPAKAASYTETLRRETSRLDSLIEALLMLSRLDQDRVQIARVPVDLNALAREYATDRESLAQSRDLALCYEPAADLPLVLADYHLIGQVLSILLTNAFNYTPAGGRVTIRTVHEAREGGCCAGFRVSDTGPGILPEDQAQLFTRFFRGKAGRESSASGTGLGLAIAREIVDRHAGQIAIDSTGVPGEGATFTVWLPLAPEIESAAQH